MIHKESLMEGDFYFLVHYVTNKLSIPEIETLIYLGINMGDNFVIGEIDEYYFQDSESYQRHSSILNKKCEEGEIHILNEAQLAMIFDINGLIVLLNDIKMKKQ